MYARETQKARVDQVKKLQGRARSARIKHIEKRLSRIETDIRKLGDNDVFIFDSLHELRIKQKRTRNMFLGLFGGK